ncbi:hypothetical protein D4765_11795 [Subtercola vilae]|uniref:Uncharacterized protein n=1 Tax=Subtercola vilae TaxID=2056433 RepID=A0A4T2BV14_9MICO|nr:hypothetical protein D4765_11795 [Subtercola vilae]
MNVNLQDVTALYARIGAGYTVTKDAITFGADYADAKAIAIFNAINQYKIGEDKKAIGGQNFALAVPATPTVTPSANGGSIPATTAVPVKVAVRTGSNFSWGGSGIASSAGSATTGSGTTNSAVVTVPAVRGAVAYDWFVNGFWYTTTTVNTVTVTTIPTANATAPITNVSGLSTVYPTSVPTVDASASSLDFNGLIASLAGDYATSGYGLVTPGQGSPSGAKFLSLDGAPLTFSGGSVNEFDTLNQYIYDSVQLSPDRYMVSSQQSKTLSKAFLAAGTSSVYLEQGNGDGGRTNASLGGHLNTYFNAITGDRIEIEVNPNLPAGTIIATRDSIPFPNSNISNTMELRTQEDLTDWDYPAGRQSGAGGGPRYDGEVYSVETFINRAPVSMGVLQNITAS